jgi:pyruvate dehydrogenase E2 component (dihydrolipoamide acetyltransferase)
MAEFVMPSLGADMEAGTLVAWLKQPGETVERGEVIAEIDTDKGVIEVECFTSGVIEKLIIQPGEKVPVGTVMAIIQAEEQPEGASVSRELPKVKEITAPPVQVSEVIQKTQPEAARLKISPAARKAAEEFGIDPAVVKGTGPGGRITREDIERAAAERKTVAAQAEAPADKHARMRQAIAAAMARSRREIPHYYLSTQIDLSRALQWLVEENQKRAVTERLLYGVMLIKAVALALREYPEFNAVWEQDQVSLKPEIHVGVATSLRQGGLIAPALRKADQQNPGELMKNLQDLVKRARAGGLRSSELSDSTITITSLGEQGVETVFGIIYPPQVALVGFGKVVERPWVVDGQIVVRPVITATLSADHRASDGHRGGLFLAAIDRLLQEPEKL